MQKNSVLGSFIRKVKRIVLPYIFPVGSPTVLSVSIVDAIYFPIVADDAETSVREREKLQLFPSEPKSLPVETVGVEARTK